MASDNAENYGNPILLEDLLIEIFLRSSVKSLVRAKCVCKHWYGLIKNHSFEHKYLEYQKKRKPNRRLLQYFNDENRILNYAIFDDITQPSTTHHTLEYLQENGRYQEIEGPVYGLYCLYNLDSNDYIVLWNPALMVFKILPSPPPCCLPHYELDHIDVGFGIDPWTNDHKVVLFRFYYDAIDECPVYENPVVTLYNVTTNTWRPLDLGNFLLRDYVLGNSCGSCFVNGISHKWVTSGVVLAFDMGNETFRVIPGPYISEFDGHNCYSGSMSVYEEHVALVRNNDLVVNLWVMLEEGIWIKQFSIGPIPGLLWPVGFWKNEGIFLVINDSEPFVYNPNSQLALYDVNTQEMRTIGPRAMDLSFRTCLYYESLVSFDTGSEYDWNMVSDLLNPAHSRHLETNA